MSALAAVESLRPIDYDLATGVYPDMTEHGWETDDWPRIYKKVEAAHILVLHAIRQLAGPDSRWVWIREPIDISAGLLESTR